MDTYSHVLPDMQGGAAIALEKVLSQSLDSVPEDTPEEA
jgi:hypothetical protein